MTAKKLSLFILAGVFFLGNVSFRHDPAKEKEYLLKAAFIYRFSDYIDWNGYDAETFNIVVLGESGIVEPLLEISKNKRIKDKRINVRQTNNPDNIGNCHIVFVSRNWKYPISSVTSLLDYKPTLIITEQKDDFPKGGQINFLISDNKLKFQVDLKSTSRSGLKISSQLLQHAIDIKR
jgi:hypothetical protein